MENPCVSSLSGTCESSGHTPHVVVKLALHILRLLQNPFKFSCYLTSHDLQTVNTSTREHGFACMFVHYSLNILFSLALPCQEAHPVLIVRLKFANCGHLLSDAKYHPDCVQWEAAVGIVLHLNWMTRSCHRDMFPERMLLVPLPVVRLYDADGNGPSLSCKSDIWLAPIQATIVRWWGSLRLLSIVFGPVTRRSSPLVLLDEWSLIWYVCRS